MPYVGSEGLDLLVHSFRPEGLGCLLTESFHYEKTPIQIHMYIENFTSKN